MGAAAARFTVPESARSVLLRSGLQSAWQDTARYSRCASADLDAPSHGSGTSRGSRATAAASAPESGDASGAARRQRRGVRCYNCAIFAVYTWAAVISLAGAWLLFFHPWLDSLEIVSGTGLLACGAFVVINAEYLVAFWRMITEVSRLRRSVQFYRTRVKKQLLKLRSLMYSDVALKEMDARFDGSAIVAKHNLPKLKAEVSENTLRNVSAVCRLFIAPEPDHLVRGGSELREAMLVFANIFGNEYSDFSRRSTLLLQGLEASRRFREDDGVPCGTLASLVGDMLIQEDVSVIPRLVMELMNEPASEVRLAEEAQE